MTKPRKRRKRTKRHYFTQVHEDAIVKYSKSEDLKERTELYVQFIQPAFNEMVDKIVYIESYLPKEPNTPYIGLDRTPIAPLHIPFIKPPVPAIPNPFSGSRIIPSTAV